MRPAVQGSPSLMLFKMSLAGSVFQVNPLEKAGWGGGCDKLPHALKFDSKHKKNYNI